MNHVTQIIDRLWMGGQGIIPFVSGYPLVISLREVPDAAFQGLEEYKHQYGPVLVWMPMIDMAVEPPMWKLDAACALIQQAILNNQTVLVHCKEGHNRSGLVVGAYLIKICDYEPQEAIDLIQELRPGALSNQTFVQMLLAMTPTG